MSYLSHPSLGERIAELTERVKNFIVMNGKEHSGISTQIKDLCDRVNHQQTALEARIKVLEDANLAEKSEYRGRVKLFKWLSIGFGIIIAVLTILDLLHG